MSVARWQFWIDVGGTFTDCVAVAPDGARRVIKVLSSGVTKGAVRDDVEARRPAGFDPSDSVSHEVATSLAGRVANFFCGYTLTWLDEDGRAIAQSTVSDSTHDGRLRIQDFLPSTEIRRFELTAGEEAPILAIREGLGLRLDEPIPPISVRLGTTRGTNSLLTRRGAKTGFVTTRGFADVLLIANQDRPRLFDLDIQKPTPLFAAVAEINERLAADGSVLTSPLAEQVRTELQQLKDAGCEALAICLLHAFANPAHEEFVANIAGELGFRFVSVSSRLSPLIKLVSRGDTTVMDAYLNPILQGYVDALKAKLPGSDLRFMTSSGGLVTAERFTGKECVLSGPAGGVIGFSQTTRTAGFQKCIGFDMGGTSTDVARFDGRYEFEFETMKAGVRIVTPMMAIETVAAGGGSLCGFDGVKLFVGPQSAGSNPGPACYGRGGPLTVTDCNVFLDRIPPACFPFALDTAAIANRLAALCEQLAVAEFGKHYTPKELASGFLDIANAAMARAIRKVSVAKGYDPAEHVLVPFGGAGGQHACALARLLGMKTILAHPLAGVLSAYGIGHADVRRSRQLTVLEPFDQTALDRWSDKIEALVTAARDEIVAEGVPADQIGAPALSLDLRYRGVESAITILQPPDGDFAAAYVARHRQLYGYDRPNRALEFVAIRVEVVGNASKGVDHHPADGETKTAHRGDSSPSRHRGQLRLRETLRPGDVLTGPVIIAEPTSTLVIDPGFQARVLSHGEVLIEDVSLDCLGKAVQGRPDEAVDPVQLELFHHTFGSIAEQMGLTLQQTSVSTNVKERLDFSCAIFDSRGGLVVNAPHIPVHLGAMSETVRCVIRDNLDMLPGDVFVTNDPYRGGSHLPDVTVVTPVHHSQSGELLFFTASRAHHAEIGGIVPGSMPPFSKNLGEEGVLIRNFRLISGAKPGLDAVSHEAALESLLQSGPYPSRSVNDNLADLRAQVAANRIGVTLLMELVRQRGADTVQAYIRYLQSAAAAAMRQALTSLDPGEYRCTDHLDDGSPISATITLQSDQARIDFTGTGPVLPTNLNANRAIVTAAVMYVLRCLIGAAGGQGGKRKTESGEPEEAEHRASSALRHPVDLPLNGGVLEPIEIVLPECLLNPPEHADPAQCPAMVGGNVETSQRVVDVLLGAFSLAAASQGTMNNLTFGDGTFGYYETICGGAGATPNAHGADAVHTHMTNTRLTDPEIIERRYPVRLHEFSIRRGSGGAGKHRGGDGITRRIEFLRPVRVSLLTERRGPYPPYGLQGGLPGAFGQNTLQRAVAEFSREGDADAAPPGRNPSVAAPQENLGGKASLEVAPGDVLTIHTPGGGGYGAP